MPTDDFAREVRAGLSKKPQKELPCQYLYDDIGTALFDTITLLPEYGLMRADERLLERYAEAILERLARPVIVAELGSGSGRKTRWILEALARRQPVVYYPVDTSALALDRCRLQFGHIGSISVLGLEQPYLEGLSEVARRRQSGQTLLVLFLGSTIGNFTRRAADEFLGEIRRRLKVGDALLVGTDLEKDLPLMLAAYDDPTGVTAAFNLNLLARINRELGGDFELRNFRHEARYNAGERRVEMHLRALRSQTATLAGNGFACKIREGETIWTEASHKYRLEELPAMAARAGFHSAAQWVDPEWPFAENLWVAAPS